MFKPWTNRTTRLFDMTDKENPQYIPAVEIEKIISQKGKRGIVVLKAMMPNAWLVNCAFVDLGVFEGECSDPDIVHTQTLHFFLRNCEGVKAEFENISIPIQDDNIAATIMRAFVETDVEVYECNADDGKATI